MPESMLPSRYSVKQILAVAKWFRDNPTAVGRIRDGLGSTGHSMNGAQWFSWFRHCLDQKISSKDPRQPRGKKSSAEYELELTRLRPYIGTRLVIHWVAPILGRRVKAALANRMRDPADYR